MVNRIAQDAIPEKVILLGLNPCAAYVFFWTVIVINVRHMDRTYSTIMRRLASLPEPSSRGLKMIPYALLQDTTARIRDVYRKLACHSRSTTRMHFSKAYVLHGRELGTSTVNQSAVVISQSLEFAWALSRLKRASRSINYDRTGIEFIERQLGHTMTF